MNRPAQIKQEPGVARNNTSELLLLPDGRVLVHNLTPEFARLLSKLNPDDPQILPRSLNEARHEDR